MLERGFYSIVRSMVVVLGVGSFCLLLLTNVWLISTSSVPLDLAGFLYDDQSLNFVEQGLFVENLPYLTTTPAQQRQHEDGPQMAEDPALSAQQQFQAQTLRNTALKSQHRDESVNEGVRGDSIAVGTPGLISRSAVAVPGNIEHHDNAEGVKGDYRTPKTISHDSATVPVNTEPKGNGIVVRAPKTASPSAVASGYVLAVNYYEQQTIGSRNLLQLQCLAKHLRMAVVKPVMKSSFLVTPLDDKAQDSYLKFEDSFDLNGWASYAAKASYSSLVEWKGFIGKAPRDVILVQFNYPSLSVIRSRKKIGPVTQRAQKERYQTGCAEKWPSNSELAFLDSKNFRIVRRVCFNFYHGDTLTLKEFDEHMFGSNSRSNVTVIFDAWRGLGSSQRVLIAGVCAGVYPIQEHIQPSRRLLRDAEAYVQTYFKGSPFVAIMGRLEMSLLTVHSKDFTVSSCLRETVSEVLGLKKAEQLQETFVSIDIGKYGTKKWRSKMNSEMSDSLEGFFTSIYGGAISVKDWETSFEKVSSSTDAGYIALLQKVIVTKARCIVFVGGGAFQRHALNLYRQLDANRNKECLSIVRYCTSTTKLIL